ncbi:serine protease [Vibrio crassostreae]|uniref:serine protease n=1 Tax=Vibrio crassostreae TaxID=246167 RepID=UPI001B309ED7|nr:serine protease [Vibrio crassostreae]
MKFQKLALALSTIPLLSGCVFKANGFVEFADDVNDDVEVGYHPIGIPYIFGGHGSSTPITKDLSITAAHVAVYNYSNVIAYHKYCDVAIIESDNSDVEIPKRGLVYPDSKITHYGIGLSGMLVKGEGTYKRDVRFDDGIKECAVSLSDGAMQSGMSGGGAYNDKGEFVGVNVAIASDVTLDGKPVDYDRTSMFVSTAHMEQWIEDVIEAYDMGYLD